MPPDIRSVIAQLNPLLRGWGQYLKWQRSGSSSRWTTTL
ncbi:MAG: hypothetical protein IPO43_16950 [Rhodoferax sp.]|nr:hypothetical protein [Rhodoferax sp.]